MIAEMTSGGRLFRRTKPVEAGAPDIRQGRSGKDREWKKIMAEQVKRRPN